MSMSAARSSLRLDPPPRRTSAGRATSARIRQSRLLTLVVGLGEVGRPLLEILRGTHQTAGRDVEEQAFHGVRILHLCFPFGADFVSAGQPLCLALRAGGGRGEQYRGPRYDQGDTEGNGHRRRVQPGAREACADDRGIAAIPEVRRGHVAGGRRRRGGPLRGRGHDHPANVVVRVTRTGQARWRPPTSASWSRGRRRWIASAASVDADYWETLGFFEEIGFLPPVGFEPGYIGGHCVMPNLDLLEQVRRSLLTDAIRNSNDQRAREWRTSGRSTQERLAPRPRGTQR